MAGITNPVRTSAQPVRGAARQGPATRHSAVDTSLWSDEAQQDADADLFVVCQVLENRLVPAKRFDTLQAAAETAQMQSRDGGTSCVMLERDLLLFERGEGIRIAYRNGKPFALGDNLQKALRRTRSSQERQHRVEQRQREKQERRSLVEHAIIAVFAIILGALAVMTFMHFG
ncbi:hypothetical protein [Radicibacter daui]|uniref:hypothetical protein n=1 Tax=Radicibacter daui TaxID=3064829 RepID=UPI00404698FD